MFSCIYLLVIFFICILLVLLILAICMIVQDFLYLFVLVSYCHTMRVNTHLLKSLAL